MTAERLLLRQLGAYPRAVQSRAMVSAVRLGGRANGDECRAAWTTLVGGMTPRTVEGCSRTVRAQGTQRGCEEVKVRQCHLGASSPFGWHFIAWAGTEGAARSPRKD
uniref:Uncharacterized protein n=1 Tax=Oryza meridionalis TaxID=40149 RepID=A0A0E0CEJ2_9ORYZ